MDLELKKN